MPGWSATRFVWVTFRATCERRATESALSLEAMLSPPVWALLHATPDSVHAMRPGERGGFIDVKERES
jgi:hypothetical protein